MQAALWTASATCRKDVAAFAAASRQLLLDCDVYEIAALQPAWAPAVAAAVMECLG